MKKYFNIILLVLFIPLISLGQNQYFIDSLNKVIKKTSHDIVKVDALVSISKAYWYSNPDTAYVIASEALVLAEKLSYKKGIAGALSSIGVCFRYKGDYPKAIEHHFKSLKIRMHF